MHVTDERHRPPRAARRGMLISKLRPTTVRSHEVPARLEDAVRPRFGCLTLLRAGAGYGKTTVLGAGPAGGHADAAVAAAGAAAPGGPARRGGAGRPAAEPLRDRRRAGPELGPPASARGAGLRRHDAGRLARGAAAVAGRHGRPGRPAGPAPARAAAARVPPRGGVRDAAGGGHGPGEPRLALAARPRPAHQAGLERQPAPGGGPVRARPRGGRAGPVRLA